MIAKALLLLCALSAATSSDVDSIFEEIFGSTEHSAHSASSTEPKVERYQPCTTAFAPDSEKGECVPYYLCKQMEGSAFIDVRGPVENVCKSYLDVCCAAANRIQLNNESETKVIEVE